MDNKIKIRSITNEAGVDESYIEFYAAVFNQRSKLLFENNKYFYEIIERGAFTELLAKDNLNVKAVINHDDNKLLGRTKSGTLQLEEDDYGLKAIVKVGKTTLWNDTLEQIERGDLFESSFKFKNNKSDESIRRDENGDLVKTIRKISGLYDVSIVNDAAYSNTNINARLRSFKEFEEAEQAELKRKEQVEAELVTLRNYINKIKNI